MTAGTNLTSDLGYLRVGMAIPRLRVSDVKFNVANITESIQQAQAEDVQVLAFPEMAITGYTLGDLVQHKTLLEAAWRGIEEIRDASSESGMVIIVGLPLAAGQGIFNCAAVLNKGRILGIVPKVYLPNYKEFYEDRWFTEGSGSQVPLLEKSGQAIPFGADLLFRVNEFDSAILGVEICEDLWLPFASHEYAAVAGATVLFGLSASNEVLGKADWRRTMVSSESGRCLGAYCYVSCGAGESTNDVVFGGHAIAAENGTILKESQRFAAQPRLEVVDLDVERLNFDRRTTTSFQAAGRHVRPYRLISAEAKDPPVRELQREIDPHPFVPADPAQRAARCREIFSMQVAGLAQKLTGANLRRIVLGVSGGLDSTLALLVAVRTMDHLGLPRENVHAFTLPGFGTTPRTKNNATELCRGLKVSFEEVSIVSVCTASLGDLGQADERNVVFENVQARYRTGFLFNKANELSAINLGTGDLTEVALGWSTFAGDQLSHYHVNASVPKTLVRYLVRWVADEELPESPARGILYDVLETPISPELLPAENGRIVQKSEDIIGPVELADFYLYPFIRFGMRPGKILFLAQQARKRGSFDASYTLDDLYKWLRSFVNRFFENQFKRTCFPEGPKVGSVSLSPRGDWRMPSDASAAIWITDLEEMYRSLK